MIYRMTALSILQSLRSHCRHDMILSTKDLCQAVSQRENSDGTLSMIDCCSISDTQHRLAQRFWLCKGRFWRSGPLWRAILWTVTSMAITGTTTWAQRSCQPMTHQMDPQRTRKLEAWCMDLVILTQELYLQGIFLHTSHISKLIYILRNWRGQRSWQSKIKIALVLKYIMNNQCNKHQAFCSSGICLCLSVGRYGCQYNIRHIGTYTRWFGCLNSTSGLRKSLLLL